MKKRAELTKEIHRTLAEIEEMLIDEFGEDYHKIKKSYFSGYKVSGQTAGLKKSKYLREEVKTWLGR